MNAMIFAAGLGTRLQPLTNDRPKALVECNGITLLEHAIAKLKFYGFTKIVVNVHHFSQLLIDFITTHDFGVPVVISDESDLLLDTGGGMVFAKNELQGDEPFLICNVDIVSSIDFSKMIAYHKAHNALATLAVSDRKTARYFLFDENNRLCGWENKKTGEQKIVHPHDTYTSLAFSGIQVVSPKIFDQITETGKFSITNLYLRLAQHNTILAYNHTGDFWLDIGKYDEFAENERKIKAQNFDYLR